jgi:hypothetical protein
MLPFQARHCTFFQQDSEPHAVSSLLVPRNGEALAETPWAYPAVPPHKSFIPQTLKITIMTDISLKNRGRSTWVITLNHKASRWKSLDLNLSLVIPLQWHFSCTVWLFGTGKALQPTVKNKPEG